PVSCGCSSDNGESRSVVLVISLIGVPAFQRRGVLVRNVGDLIGWVMSEHDPHSDPLGKVRAKLNFCFVAARALSADASMMLKSFREIVL
ncbi:MAG: hypothetical protein J0J15_26125, partial [Mesorhizobium sp.]|nr:hypothetical protein [Mesorhizobium sp.]